MSVSIFVCLSVSLRVSLSAFLEISFWTVPTLMKYSSVINIRNLCNTICKYYRKSAIHFYVGQRKCRLVIAQTLSSTNVWLKFEINQSMQLYKLCTFLF